MEEGQIASWGTGTTGAIVTHLHTRWLALQLGLQGSLASVSSALALVTWMHTHVTEMSPATWPREWVEHQTQYGVCKEPPVGTAKAEGFEEKNNEPAT